MADSKRAASFIGLLFAGAILAGAGLLCGACAASLDNLPPAFAVRYAYAITLAPIPLAYVVAVTLIIRWWQPNRDRANGLALGMALPILLLGALWLVLSAMAR